MQLTHSTLLFFSMFSGSNSCLESFGSFFLCTSRSCLLALATGKKNTAFKIVYTLSSVCGLLNMPSPPHLLVELKSCSCPHSGITGSRKTSASPIGNYAYNLSLSVHAFWSGMCYSPSIFQSCPFLALYSLMFLYLQHNVK